MVEYRKRNILHAKELRKNMTPWERKLWYEFLRDYPVRFQRQKAIGDYIADFYCAKARLMVELDGGGHYEAEQAERDENRTEDLSRFRLNVLRFSNLDVSQNFSGVCEEIDRVVKDSLPQSPAATAPSSEGAKGKAKDSLPQSPAATAPSSEGAKGKVKVSLPQSPAATAPSSEGAKKTSSLPLRREVARREP